MERKSGASPPENTKRIVIEIMNGPEDGRIVVCDEMPILIGRTKDSVVRLPYDQMISRRHARIVESKHGLLLSDLNSTNGTFVEDKRIRGSTIIEPDILFRVGATLLKLELRPAE